MFTYTKNKKLNNTNKNNKKSLKKSEKKRTQKRQFVFNVLKIFFECILNIFLFSFYIAVIHLRQVELSNENQVIFIRRKE